MMSEEIQRVMRENENLRKKVAEYRVEATRCRKLAKAIIDSIDSTGVLIEFSTHYDDSVHIAVCVPSGDEEKIARLVIEEIASHLGSRAVNMHAEGTGADEDPDAVRP